MTIDEQDIRERLVMIAGEIHYAADGDALLAAGRGLRRRRRAIAAVSAAMLVAAVIGVSIPLLANLRGRPPSPAITHSRYQAPLADVYATPKGWAPVAFGDGQISVPSTWITESASGSEGCSRHDPGRVFVAEADVLTNVGPCGPADNVITIRHAGSTPLAGAQNVTVHGIAVELGRAWRGSTTYVERALGLDITASGPLARRVLGTLTHSPLSVVLGSSGLTAPAPWRRVSFGGLRFAVPARWSVHSETAWGRCTANLEPDVLELNTATSTLISLCPDSPGDIGSDAGVPALVVGAGRHTDAPLGHSAPCRTVNGVRVCVAGPVGGAMIMTADVYIPGQAGPVELQLGLFGSGLVPAEIFGSMAPA